jgi:hypothetical protein
MAGHDIGDTELESCAKQTLDGAIAYAFEHGFAGMAHYETNTCADHMVFEVLRFGDLCKGALDEIDRAHGLVGHAKPIAEILTLVLLPVFEQKYGGLQVAHVFNRCGGWCSFECLLNNEMEDRTFYPAMQEQMQRDAHQQIKGGHDEEADIHLAEHIAQEQCRTYGKHQNEQTPTPSTTLIFAMSAVTTTVEVSNALSFDSS